MTRAGTSVKMEQEMTGSSENRRGSPMKTFCRHTWLEGETRPGNLWTMAPRAELAHDFVPMKTGECACVGGKEHVRGNREVVGPLASSPGGAKERVSAFPSFLQVSLASRTITTGSQTPSTTPFSLDMALLSDGSFGLTYFGQEDNWSLGSHGEAC